MPIVFQQPGPISEAASAGAGAAQQFSRDLPTLERQQAQLAEMLARHYQAGGGGGGAQLPQRPQQGALFTGGAQGQNMQAPTQAPQQRDDPLVQAEVIRLQQLKNGMAYVDQQQQGGSLTQEEADNLRTQLQTGINPLQQRQQRAQAKATEEQAKTMMHQNAQLTSMQGMDSTQRAQRAQQNFVTVRDDEGNVVGYSHYDEFTGKSTFHAKEKEQREATERGGMTAALRTSIRRGYAQDVNRELTAARAATADPAARRPWMDTPAGIEGEIDRRTNAHHRSIGTDAIAGQGGRAGGAAPVVDTSKWEWGTPRTQPQRELEAVFSNFRNNLRAAPETEVSPQSARQIAGLINEAQALIQEHGPPVAMPEDRRGRFQALVQEISQRIPERGPGSVAPSIPTVTNRARLRDRLLAAVRSEGFRNPSRATGRLNRTSSLQAILREHGLTNEQIATRLFPRGQAHPLIDSSVHGENTEERLVDEIMP